MKKLFFVFGSLLIFTSIDAQDFKFPKNVGSYTVGIPGTQIMIDQAEVSVSDWFAFVYQNYFEEADEHFFADVNAVMPDTNLLPEKYHILFRIFYRNAIVDTTKVYINQYFFKGSNSHQKFRMPLSKTEKDWGKNNLPLAQLQNGGKMYRLLDLPMVGITYEQAKLYLNWRMNLAEENKSVIKCGYTISARMMTIEEWQKWSTVSGPRHPENKTAHIDTTNEKGCYLINVKMVNPCETCQKGIDFCGAGAVPVYSYFPDNLGIYNLFGNVWEMTNEKGIAIGGSYNNFAINSDASKTLTYSHPDSWIGFRCVLEFAKQTK